MNTTPNLGLKKPLQTEFYNVDDFNYNSDTIDQAIHDLSEDKQDALSTSQMNAVNSGMTTAKREKLDALPTASELNTAFNGKQNTLTTAQINAVNSGITSAKVSKLDVLPTNSQLNTSLDAKAAKVDITDISVTGSTNNTGSTILAGTLFYKDGTLSKALSDIASGATLTRDTNYTQTDVSDIIVFTAKASDVRNTSSHAIDNASTLSALYNQILVDYYKNNRVSVSGIGVLDNTALKSILPNPVGFGNYTQVYCKMETEISVVIYAVGMYIGKLAKCYLFYDSTDYYLTDWQILR